MLRWNRFVQRSLSFLAQDILNEKNHQSAFNPEDSYFQEEATVDETIRPRRVGWVKFQGSWWSARCMQDVTLIPGEVVRVIGIHNITLLVEPIQVNGKETSESLTPHSSSNPHHSHLNL
jgi:membrane protein implicated in regulation of membrane protease activity